MVDGDLTDSVYSMIVLAYATLAATTYLFTNLENRARQSLSKIDSLKKGAAKKVWELQATDLDVGLADKKPAIQTVIEEYDTVKSGSNAKVERWAGLQLVLFISVSISALLLIPVLILKLNVLGGSIHLWLSVITKTALVAEQLLASLTVPIVGLNIRKMSIKLRRIEGLEYNLDMLAGAMRIAQGTNNQGANHQAA